jgi:hypothetical protein
MKKTLASLAAVAAIGAAALTTTGTAAEARWWGAGWGPGPYVAGAVVGGAIVAAATAPGRYYYTPYGVNPYYGPVCQQVWNGYYWYRSCY